MDSQKRIESLNNFLKADPNNPNIIGDLVDLYLQVGPIKSAKKLLGRGIEFNPENPRLQFQQATILIAEGQYKGASQVLEGILSTGIDNPGVRYNLALALAMQSNIEKAHEHLLIIRKNPTQCFAEADILYLRTLHHLGRMDEAIELATSLCETYSNNGDLLGVMSLLYLDKQDLKLARYYAEQAQQIKPNNSESLSTLGTLHLEDMETHISIPYFKKILNTQPKDGRAWLGLGLSYLLEQDLDEGERCLEQATVYMPGHLGSWNSLTWVRITKGNLTGAEEAINASMEQDRTFAETHGTLAVVQIFKGERDLAKQSIKRALRLDPNCFSGLFAQTLLLNPETHEKDIQTQVETLMNKPLSEDGDTIKSNLQRYSTKFDLKGKISKH